MKRRTRAQLVGTISLIVVAVSYVLVSRFAKPWDDVVGIGSIPVVLLASFLLFMGTTAQIQQSPDQARGKRLCVAGTIAEAGRLRVAEHEQITYLAVGPRTPAVGQAVRFCGTTLGRHDVTFTSEGPKRTALVLGMFEAGATAEHAP